MSQRYIDNFERLKGLFTMKYGPPDTHITKWDSEFRCDMMGDDNLGAQIRAGHVQLGATWRCDVTSIVLGCTGEDFEINNVLTYASQELVAWAKNREEETDVEDL